MKRMIASFLAGGMCSMGGFYWYSKPTTSSGDPLLKANKILGDKTLVPCYQEQIMRGLFAIRKSFLSYGVLHKLEGFQYLDTYQIKDGNSRQLYTLFSPKDAVCGHSKVQHGGASATIVDQACGFLAAKVARKTVATANLSLKYLKPIQVGKAYMLKAEVVKAEGRDINIQATIVDLETNVVVLKSESLFKTVDWNPTHEYLLKAIFRDSEELKPNTPQNVT